MNSLLDDFGIFVNNDLDRPLWSPYFASNESEYRSSFSSESSCNSPSDSSDSGFLSDLTTPHYDIDLFPVTSQPYDQCTSVPVAASSYSTFDGNIAKVDFNDCDTVSNSPEQFNGVSIAAIITSNNSQCTYATTTAQCSPAMIITPVNFANIAPCHVGQSQLYSDSVQFVEAPVASSVLLGISSPALNSAQTYAKLLPKASGTPSLETSLANNHETDEWRKKQTKMAKNREAAHLSRKRKNEYVESLQNQLKETIIENDRLRRENEHLKMTVDKLNKENRELSQQRLASSSGSQQPSEEGSTKVKKFRIVTGGQFLKPGLRHKIPSSRNAVCLLTVVFLFTVNFGPNWTRQAFKNFENNEQKSSSVSYDDQSQSIDGQINGSRVVSSTATEIGRAKNTSANVAQTNETRRLKRDVLKTEKCKSLCSNETITHFDTGYVNETESLRLLQEINSWFGKHEKMRPNRRRPTKPGVKDGAAAAVAATNYDLDYLQPPGQQRGGESVVDGLVGGGDLDGFKPRRPYFNGLLMQQRKLYERFKRLSLYNFADNAEHVDRLERRVDNELRKLQRLKQLEELLQNYSNNTLHVLPEGYLVLPRLTYNGTASLKISLVMSLFSSNDSSVSQQDSDVLSMMQIECEVINLVHLPKIGLGKGRRNGRTTVNETDVTARKNTDIGAETVTSDRSSLNSSKKVIGRKTRSSG